MIFDHIKKVQSGETDIVTETKKVLGKFSKLNSEYKFMTVISDELAIECAEFVSKNPNLPLAGLFVTIKDCLCVKDVESTASSRILKGYLPVFDATVVKQLKEAGAIIIGKTVQDEFGFGSFSTNTGLDYDTPLNPNDKERVAGGSSGGCGVATKLCIDNNIPHISIAESTGGSIENPASFCGVIGFCPTYGRVSRNGLLSYSNSLDKIGVMAEKIDEVSQTFEIISGEDLGESTSLPDSKFDGKIISKEKFKVGIIKDSMTSELKAPVADAMYDTISKLKEKGAQVEEVTLPFTFEFGLSAYYIIAMSEASTNLSSLCGLRYGQQELKSGEHFTEYFSRVRSEHFGNEVKRRIMLGTFTRMAGYRDAFYIRAAKARTKVIEEYKKLFEKYDVLISPTMPFVAPKFSEIKELKPIDHYLADVMTVGPNLAGVPHMSFPISDIKGLPIGMMVIADHNKEDVLFGFGKLLEELK